MAHKRKQIRNALAVILTGLKTSGTKVFSGRIYDLQESDLPCVEIIVTQESIEYVSQSQQREQQRLLSVNIVARARSSSGVDNVLDTMAAEIEEAMDASSLLAGLINNYSLTDSSIQLDGDGSQALGTVQLAYELTYYTIEGV